MPIRSTSVHAYSAIYIIQKTPPIGETGGEKQYKDYEKNPMLSFILSFDAANIGIFPICNVFFDFFSKNTKERPHNPEPASRRS